MFMAIGATFVKSPRKNLPDADTGLVPDTVPELSLPSVSDQVIMQYWQLGVAQTLVSPVSTGHRHGL